jgi:N-acetylglutamate synthase-like GNAT family acetyltransferase
MHFRDYTPADRDACLALFDDNCPAFFAPNERADYDAFLAGVEASLGAATHDGEGYVIVEQDGRVVGAHGVQHDATTDTCRLTWILHANAVQGRGYGRLVMARVLRVARAHGATSVQIAASDRSAPFFARFGAKAEEVTPDGWGPGMHRIDMRLTVSEA